MDRDQRNVEARRQHQPESSNGSRMVDPEGDKRLQYFTSANAIEPISHTPSQSHPATTDQCHNHNITTRAHHKYTIRRPRALQYTYRKKFFTASDEASADSTPFSPPSEKQTHSSAQHHHGSGEVHGPGHLPEPIEKQRQRMDLFIDLIWVGIIGNLSEVFSSLYFKPGGANPGFATLVFILVFLPSWRIWNSMREFMNNYYMDDLMQRMFTFWILLLSVFYGNQLAYLPEDIDQVKVWVISAYLVIMGSFALAELLYSFFIPWLRRLMIVSSIVRVPLIALWVAAIYIPGYRAVGPICAAVAWEYALPIAIDSPLGDRLTPMEYKKALDVHHFQSRMSNFFIIVLGEGVLQLIKDGPLGLGIDTLTGPSTWVLMIYFNFSFLYFNLDGSRTYISAVKQKSWRTIIWVFWHIPIFASLLIFVACVMFIIRHQVNSPADLVGGESKQLTEEEVQKYLYNSVWTCAISLAVVVASMTVLALLDKPQDPPGTLKVNNRYARLAGRVVYVVVVLCVPLAPNLGPQGFLGIAGGMLVGITLWEWNACLERGGKLIEPKGLTLMMSRELKDKKTVGREGD